jgi:hypothetical protein
MKVAFPRIRPQIRCRKLSVREATTWVRGDAMQTSSIGTRLPLAT